MKKKDKIRIGISVGDVNGIGLEVILKTFADSRMLDFGTPIVFSSNKVVSFHRKTLKLSTVVQGIDHIKKAVPNKLNVLNIDKSEVVINLGQETKAGGDHAYLSLEKATQALINNEVDVLVTAPINKNNIQSDQFNFQGHTEYLENRLNGESLMILMTKELKIGLITGHIPIAQVSTMITSDLLEKKVEIMHKSLIQDFQISKPKIAVLGINPHCGDHGVIGDEDDKIVSPTIQKIQDSGKLVYGPFAADSFFGNGSYKKFDGVLAMYHDQGLAPFKTLAFGEGVNYTAGLSKIRTSPDHGTAYEIAGKGQANSNSFMEAYFSAIDIYKKRQLFLELSENKLLVTKGK